MSARQRGSLVLDSPVYAQPTAWQASDVARIDVSPALTIPLIRGRDLTRTLDGIDTWDMWPIQNPDGSRALIGGREFWMALSAPAFEDAELRHDAARIRLLERLGPSWRDCGPLLPDAFSPGSREWAGSAVYRAADHAVTLFFTVAGRRGETPPTFEQRIFKTTGTVTAENEAPTFTGWSDPVEIVHADDSLYMKVVQREGGVGIIKAFRDPQFFRDPRDGNDYLLFTASLKNSASAFNGAVGIAMAQEGHWHRWTLLPPLITADTLNNELERPHIVMHDGRYYLFWSTQTFVFAPDGPSGPNGLYGMVADRLLGPYTPLNGTGLVAANPPEEPEQAYSWLVLDTLEVASFVNYWGLEGRSRKEDLAFARRQFGGVPAPRFKLQINSDRTSVVSLNGG